MSDVETKQIKLLQDEIASLKCKIECLEMIKNKVFLCGALLLATAVGFYWVANNTLVSYESGESYEATAIIISMVLAWTCLSIFVVSIITKGED